MRSLGWTKRLPSSASWIARCVMLLYSVSLFRNSWPCSLIFKGTCLQTLKKGTFSKNWRAILKLLNKSVLNLSLQCKHLRRTTKGRYVLHTLALCVAYLPFVVRLRCLRCKFKLRIMYQLGPNDVLLKFNKSVLAAVRVMSSEAALHNAHVMQCSITRRHKKLC